MKTHLPHGLRVALMAALASVSLTPYAAVAGLDGWKDPSGGTSVNISLKSSDYQYVYDPTGKATPLKLTIAPNATTFLKSKAKYLYVTKKSYTGDIYFTANNSPFGTSTGYYFVGVGGNATLSGNLYIRSTSTAAYTVGGTMTAIDSGSTVTKDAYLGLDDNSIHSGAVYLASGGTVQGTSTLEIASGTFSGTVAVGNSNANLDGGTNLIISGGTFNNTIVAGNTGTGTSTITGGTHTTISSKSTFNTTVYGGSTNADTTINGGVYISITGGTFGSSRNVYALGSAGTVNGDVNLTIGNNAKFSGNNIISAGTDGSATYSGTSSTSTVTLKDLTATSSLATNSTITVDGGQQKSVLVMDNVDTTIKAKLSNFTSMKVTNGSELTLNSATNANLGGVSSVVVDDNSTLNLDSGTGQAWTDYTGSIEVKSDSKLHLSGATAAKSLIVGNGSTLSVKEGDLFTGDADAGSSISVTDATLDASEGNWDLNKAATVSNVRITGGHDVSFGSIDDAASTVTMSGTISTDADSTLFLQNTAIAANTTVTLSGNIVFEEYIQNSGRLIITDGSSIGIDEESMSIGGHFVEYGEQSANGFLNDGSLLMATGGEYEYNLAELTLTLDGKADTNLTLKTTQTESGVNQLWISGFAGEEAGNYFVNEGDVSYSRIQDVASRGGKTLSEIVLADNGAGATHQLTLDSNLAEEVTIVSESDHAKVSLANGVVLNASQTAINGAANEVHVTGEGTVLLDNSDKISQLAGTATMKLDSNDTTITSEAKMTGKLEVGANQTLTVKEEGSIGSFSSVELGMGSKLTSENSDTIQSLSGSGTLEKTGAGKLAISGDSSRFTEGSVNIKAGTLEVQNDMNAASLSGSGKLAKTGEGTMSVADASSFTGDIEATGGKLELEQVVLDTAKSQKVSVSGGATVNLLKLGDGADVALKELDISGQGTFGVYTGTETADANVVGLTLAEGNKIVIGAGGGTLEANLTTEEGSILDFTAGAQLTMGCTLEMDDKTIVLLSEDNFDGLKNGTLKTVTLFDGIDNTSMDTTSVVICRGSAEGAETLTAQVDFHTDGLGNGTLSVKSIPEPTTGTLSLLALAGLCARRRRKH